MKKLFFVYTIALLWAGMAWGQDIRDKAYEKIYDIYADDSPVKSAAMTTGTDEKGKPVEEKIFKYPTIITTKDENGEEVEKTVLKDLTVYYFDGFDFNDYKARDPDLNEMNKAEIDAIKNGYVYKVGDYEKKVTGYKQDKTCMCEKCEPSKTCESCEIRESVKICKPKVYSYSIIGHSQGGLRALGYLTQLEKKYPDDLNDIDAVITISGIDQGLKMLDGGLPAFKNRASRKINIVGNGLQAVGVASIDLGILSILLSITGDPLIDLAGHLLGGVLETTGGALLMISNKRFAQALLMVLSFLPKRIQAYWLLAWITDDAEQVPQIRDMIPGSKYIENNVVKREPLDPFRAKTGKKVLTGEWRFKSFGIIKIWYFWIGLVDEYAWYTAYESVPQFNPDVPVGFIVGLDSKTLNMIEEKSDRDKARDGIKAAETAFGVAQGWHIAKCVGLIGLVTGSVTYANDADKARKFVANFESELNDLKGSTENDGFVALENQYIPKSFTHPTTKEETIHLNAVLGGTDEGYVKPHEYKNYNHKNIVENSDAFEKAHKLVLEAIKLKEERKLGENHE